MIIPIVLSFIAGAAIFIVVPQLAKFRATTGIDQKLANGDLTFPQKLWLMILGLKTPFINTLTVFFSFMLAESDKLMGFGWDKFISKEHAAWVAMGLWALSLWSHFQGLNAAAAMPPVTAPPAVKPLRFPGDMQ